MTRPLIVIAVLALCCALIFAGTWYLDRRAKREAERQAAIARLKQPLRFVTVDDCEVVTERRSA